MQRNTNTSKFIFIDRCDTVGGTIFFYRGRKYDFASYRISYYVPQYGCLFPLQRYILFLTLPKECRKKLRKFVLIP